MKSRKDFLSLHRHAFSVFLVCALLTLGVGYVAFGPGIGRKWDGVLPLRLPTQGQKTLFFANETKESRRVIQESPSNIEEQEEQGDQVPFAKEPRLFLKFPPISEPNNAGETKANQLQLIVATLRIPGKEFVVVIPEGSTVYDMMKIATETQDFHFKGKEFAGGLGFFIEEIDGVRQNQKYWIYYLNGKKANAGVSHVFLTQNDIVEWRYENAEY